ncbi:MAG TPA: anthrone oxygenase family protein [Pyrinomonadaceae bacterium]|nr:anthrone oxygenase family protein [Pyrinomonadaceae bacterium]
MAKRSTVTQVVLCLFALSAALLTGGGIFEHMVVTPLWADSPPESVTQWPYGGIQRKFFIIFSPAYYLCSLALVIASWWMPRQQRVWALVAGLSGLVIMVATFSFFIPILQKTQVTRGAGLSGEEITRLVNQFKTWNWARWAVLIGGWIAGLRAFSLSWSRESH